ncbi:MAG: DUF3024 domain-containing protein [Porticoccaceae bacterium]|nr:DUF3024 domain-containing protein [Porticoccaceae bacterium]
MAISEFEIRRCEKLVGEYVDKHRPPPYVRNEVDLSFRIKDQSVELFEIRASYSDPDEKVESMIAKTTYVKKSGAWKVYWQRADLKWHSYQPTPEVATLEEFLVLLENDEHACFYG